MKALQTLQKKHPELTSLIIADRYVRGKNFTYGQIDEIISKFIDKDDYRTIKKEVIREHLRQRTI